MTLSLVLIDEIIGFFLIGCIGAYWPLNALVSVDAGGMARSYLTRQEIIITVVKCQRTRINGGWSGSRLSQGTQQVKCCVKNYLPSGDEISEIL